MFLSTKDHVEGYLELSAKTKSYFTTAFALWDADFYVKVDDDVHVNIGERENQTIFYFYLKIVMSLVISTSVSAATLGVELARYRTKPRVYIGCMKSGPVLAQK